MSVLKIKGENTLLCHKSTEQDMIHFFMFYVHTHLYSAQLVRVSVKCLNFSVFKNSICAIRQRGYICVVCVLHRAKQ